MFVCSGLVQLISAGFSQVSLVIWWVGWWLDELGCSHSHVWQLAGYWPGISCLLVGVPCFFSLRAFNFQQASWGFFTGLSQGSKGGKIRSLQDLSKPRLGSHTFSWSNPTPDGRCLAAKSLRLFAVNHKSKPFAQGSGLFLSLHLHSKRAGDSTFTERTLSLSALILINYIPTLCQVHWL